MTAVIFAATVLLGTAKLHAAAELQINVNASVGDPLSITWGDAGGGTGTKTWSPSFASFGAAAQTSGAFSAKNSAAATATKLTISAVPDANWSLGTSAGINQAMLKATPQGGAAQTLPYVLEASLGAGATSKTFTLNLTPPAAGSNNLTSTITVKITASAP
jgi:hypothetical protein